MQCNIQLPNITKDFPLLRNRPTWSARVRRRWSRACTISSLSSCRSAAPSGVATAYTVAQPALHRLVGIRRTDPGRRRGTVAGTLWARASCGWHLDERVLRQASTDLLRHGHRVAKSAGCFCAKVHSAAHKSWLPLSGAAGSAHLIHPILSLPGRGVTAVALCFKAAATLRQ